MMMIGNATIDLGGCAAVPADIGEGACGAGWFLRIFFSLFFADFVGKKEKRFWDTAPRPLQPPCKVSKVILKSC